MDANDWKWVALTLIRYLVARDKSRVHDVIRKAKLEKFRTEIQVAYATEKRTPG